GGYPEKVVGEPFRGVLALHPSTLTKEVSPPALRSQLHDVPWGRQNQARTPLGVFAPLVGALVFKTSQGFEQSSLWVRFPYTPVTKTWPSNGGRFHRPPAASRSRRSRPAAASWAAASSSASSSV